MEHRRAPGAVSSRVENFPRHRRTASMCAKLFGILAVAAFCGTLAAELSATDFAFVTTTDYSSGTGSVIWLDGSYATEKNVVDIHSDAVPRWYDGLIYVVNRLGGDNIQVLDPAANFETVRQFSVGNGSNPVDIVFVSPTKAYVSRNNSTELWIVNPSTGAHTGTINLASFADGDGLPEMDRMVITGGKLFISIQRLDRNNWWLPVSPSWLAVVDVATDVLVDCDPGTPGTQGVLLTGTDPFSPIQLNPWTGRLYVSCVGWWGAADGKVEIVNPATLASEGYIFTETAAGGDINDVEILSADKGYAIVTDASFNQMLVSFNPSTGERIAKLYEPGAYVLNDIELAPGRELFLCDQTTTNPGLRIWDTRTDTQITTHPIDVGLRPFEVCFSVPVQTAAETPAVAVLAQNYPNPFNPSTTIKYDMKEKGLVTLKIYNVAGRLVRTLVNGVMDAGTYSLAWDGRNNTGADVASGIYFYKMETKDFSQTKKMVMLR